MIDFSLTEEQRACRKLVSDFAQKEIAPIAHELDEEQRHNPEIINKYFSIGLLHYSVPEEYGGAGLGSLDGCLFSEELGAACGKPFSVSVVTILEAGDSQILNP